LDPVLGVHRESLMTWLDLLRVIALFVGVGGAIMAVLIGAVWMLTKPLGEGPKRLVDIENRGRTRILMPDGTIK
jgi:cytochrome bd-type quinol oxidase subunit 2